MTTPKKRKRGSAGQTIGGMIVGFDYQIFRTTPPPHELVQKGQPVRGVSGEGDGLEVIFPDDDPRSDDPPGQPPSDADEPEAPTSPELPEAPPEGSRPSPEPGRD